MSLKTDYKDDILAVGNLRKYQMIQNNDGTVSFQDVTQYEQTGDVFGAGDINRTNQAVNEKFDSGDVVDPMLTTEPGFAADAYQTKLQFDEQNKNLVANDGTQFRFDVDENGNYGYVVTDEEGADTVIPFRKLLTSEQMSNATTLVHTLSSAGVTWTTTEDVILKESTCQNGGWAFSLAIGGVTICKGGQGTSSITLNLPFVIPKGTEVRTASNATYNLKFYRPTR